MSHLMLTKLRIVFQFQQLNMYKLRQFLQLVCLLLVAYRLPLPEVLVAALSLLDLRYGHGLLSVAKILSSLCG